MAYIPNQNDLSETDNQYTPTLNDVMGNSPEMVSTIVGKIPKTTVQEQIKNIESPENINELMYEALPAARGMSVAKEFAPSLVNSIKNVFAKINPKNWVKTVQSGHDADEQLASDIYNTVKTEANDANLNNIPLSDDIIDEAQLHLPKTRASKLLIENAKKGGYESLHKLQSDLGKLGHDALSNDSYAEQLKGHEILDTRDKILESIHDYMKKNNREDLSSMINLGRGMWKNLKETYYEHPSISKMVNKKIRLVPKNPENIFSEESIPMNRVLQRHPEISEELKKYQDAKSFMKKLRKGAYTAGGIGLVGNSLYKGSKMIDLLNSINQQNQPTQE